MEFLHLVMITFGVPMPQKDFKVKQILGGFFLLRFTSNKPLRQKQYLII